MKIDPNRWEDKVLWEVNGGTGIYVRAQAPDGKWKSVDIVFLDKESLEEWLEGLTKEGLIRLVKILLQHGE